MSTAYKLTPQLKKLILSLAREKPGYGCRKLSRLVRRACQITLSKSSINAVLKEAGIARPVGRRRRVVELPLSEPVNRIPQQVPAEQAEASLPSLAESPAPGSPIAPPVAKELSQPVSGEPPDAAPSRKPQLSPQLYEKEDITNGTILLAALDWMLGGSARLSRSLQQATVGGPVELERKLKTVLFAPLCEQADYLGALTGRPVTPDELLLAKKEMGALKFPESGLTAVSSLFNEALCARLDCSDGTSFFLDARMHTVWSSPNTPFDFAAPQASLRLSLLRNADQGLPLTIFIAPGYDVPTKEFFFLLSASSAESQVTACRLYARDKQETQSINPAASGLCGCVFGLWPRQFSSYRSLESLGEFSSFTVGGQGREYYAAECEISLRQPELDVRRIVRGAAIKRNLNDKVWFLVLASGIAAERDARGLASLYFSRWPCPQEVFQEFNRRLELFTYAPKAQRSFSLTGSMELQGRQVDAVVFLRWYLQNLERYFRRHFMPAGWEQWELSRARDALYALPVRLVPAGGSLRAVFTLPAGYPYAGELSCALQMLNECSPAPLIPGKPLSFHLAGLK